MIFWLRFAWRSCLRRRRRTLVTLTAMAFGIALLVVLGGIMVGVNDTMVTNAITIHSGNLVVKARAPASCTWSRNRLAELDSLIKHYAGLQEVLPRLQFPALLMAGDNSAPVNLLAVDPEREKRVTPVSRQLVAGSYLADGLGLILGRPAADSLRLTVGDQVLVITPRQNFPLPVVGIFALGIEAFDRNQAFMPLAAAAVLAADQSVTYEVSIFTGPGFVPAALVSELEGRLSAGEMVQFWEELLPEVAQLVRLNHFSMAIMIALVILILAFGVANALLISVMDRYRYFAILKAIGVRPRELFGLIMGESFIMCLAASLIGSVIGVLITLVWGEIGLDLSRYTSANPHFAVNAMVYPRLSLLMALGPQLLALGTGLTAAVWPALVAGSRPVNQVLRGQ